MLPPVPRAALWAVAAVSAGVLLLTAPLRAEDPPQPRLSRDTVPAAGQQRVELDVPRFGRVAVLTRSLQGASVQLVDRAEGPGLSSGSPGRADGRLDLFLEAGQYRLNVQAPESGRGEVVVLARGFVERSGEPLPQLPPLEPVGATLEDFEQRSFWLDLREQDEPLALEAIGRSLADLRLWKDGTWLVDHSPRCTTVEPTPGQPQRLCTLSATVPDGLYLLTAYGGPALPWSEGEGQPFHLRRGVPALPPGRVEGVVSPFGRDRFRDPQPADTYSLWLPEVRPAALRVGPFNPSAPHTTQGPVAEITAQSRSPEARLVATRGSGPALVEVSGAPGQPWSLHRFRSTQTQVPVAGEGEVLITTSGTGQAVDQLDATALLLRVDAEPAEVAAHRVLTIGATPWRRRFNLGGESSVFLELEPGATLRLDSRGVAARFRLQPYHLKRPKGYAEPDWQRGATATWADLPGGLYVLTLNAVPAGVADIELSRPDLTRPGASAAQTPEAPPLATAVFERVSLDPKGRYVLVMAPRADVRVGVRVVPLPADLAEPIELSLRPGQTLALTAQGGGVRPVKALGAGATGVELRVDGGAWAAERVLPPGARAVELRNTSATTQVFALGYTPAPPEPGRPLPRITQTELDALPRFPALQPGRVEGAVVGPKTEPTFAVRVEEPGLYALRSVGRLRTQGRLRTRTLPMLAVDTGSGPGDNFEIQRWLDPGDYQLTVRSLSSVVAELGVELERLPLREEGPLRAGVPGRVELAPGEGAAWTLEVPERSDWRIRVAGAERVLAVRLDEAEGWPTVRPGSEGELTLTLDPGRYRLMALPDRVGGRVVAVAEPVLPAPRLEGHGPHPLPWERIVAHTWREPAPGAERVPDRWSFTLPAPATLTLTVEGELEGVLSRSEGDSWVEHTALPSGRGFSGPLPAGDWQVALQHARRSDRAPYTLSLRTEELVLGQDRVVWAPGQVLLSVGARGVVELESRGELDVEARLWDAEGRRVAEGDDRPGDWNFLLAADLSPGLYTLELRAVGERSGQTTVRARALEAEEGPTLSPGLVQRLEPRDGAVLLPLNLPADAELLSLTARSQEAVGLALEVNEWGEWATVDHTRGAQARLLARPGAGQAWRARVWSADGRGLPVEVQLDLVPAPRLGEAALARGGVLSARPPGVGAARVELVSPGWVAFEGAPEGLRWCPAPGAACRPVPAGGVAVEDRALWLVAELPPGQTRAAVTGQRVVLGADPLRLALDAGQVARLQASGGAYTLVLAVADTGQPGLAAGTDPAPGAGPELALGPHAALVVATGATPGVALWSADGQDLPLTLSARTFPAPGVRALGADSALSLKPGEALALTPEGAVDLTLTLSRGLVAAELHEGQIRRVSWAAEAAHSERWAQVQGQVLLFNLGAESAPAQIESLPSAGAGPALRAGAPLELLLPRAGRMRVPVKASPWALELLGAEGTLLREDGAVFTGQVLPLDGQAGVLWVDHPAGRWLAWTGPQGLWGTSLPPAQPQPLPARLSPSGSSAAYALSPGQAGALTLRAGGPMLAALRVGEALIDPQLLEAGELARFTVPADGAELWVRGLGGQALSGEAELRFSPALPAGEGLGPELLLPPGGAAMVRFTVTQAGPVGLGLRGAGVRFALYAQDGAPLGVEGAAAMPTLAPGEYLLRLDLPADAPPTRARAALVGLEPPPTTPPADVVRAYRGAVAPSSSSEGDL